MQLQSDYTLRESGCRVVVIDNLHAVQPGDDVPAFRCDFQFIPVARLDGTLTLRRGQGNPTAASALVESAGVPRGVHFYLQAFDVRAGLRGLARDAGAREDAAVAVGLALETQTENKIAIGLFRS